jgi:hypothetical protein
MNHGIRTWRVILTVILVLITLLLSLVDRLRVVLGRRVDGVQDERGLSGVVEPGPRVTQMDIGQTSHGTESQSDPDSLVLSSSRDDDEISGLDSLLLAGNDRLSDSRGERQSLVDGVDLVSNVTT